MKRLLFASALALGLTATAAHAAGETPEQACRVQAFASLATTWGVNSGHFDIFLKAKRCLLVLEAPAIFEGKRTVWLIEGKDGELLAEFYGPQDSDRGLCSYRGGKFPTNGDCAFSEFFEKANQM